MKRCYSDNKGHASPLLRCASKPDSISSKQILPEVETPLGRQDPATADRPAVPSGLFNIANAARHNAYEYYVAPCMTAGLVQATVEFNGLDPPAQPVQVQRY